MTAPNLAMRAASQGGTRPPWSGKSALPVRRAISFPESGASVTGSTENTQRPIGDDKNPAVASGVFDFNVLSLAIEGVAASLTVGPRAFLSHYRKVIRHTL